MEPDCELCRHADRAVTDEPCNSCEQYSNFDRPGEYKKTLLDEFAKSAMEVILDKGILHGMPDETNPFVVDAALCAKSSYDYAAAMMAERARRDEMGNVKETK